MNSSANYNFNVMYISPYAEGWNRTRQVNLSLKGHFYPSKYES